MLCPKGKYQFKYRYQAVEANKKAGYKGKEFCNVYMCEWCGDWHLSSRNNQPKRKRKIKFKTT